MPHTRATTEPTLRRAMRTVCAWCTRVRDDEGVWRVGVQPETEIDTRLPDTHGICRECEQALRAAAPH